ncbi:MAG: hypothetical protein LBO79_10450, partial [Zoogloeaceae bacterium]|nr:hypothetical protein [Zoogloeaceae bacterium]
PVPSVIHWKSGHYAAIVEAEGDAKGGMRYRIRDAALGVDHWVKGEVLESEGSGYFLAKAGVPASAEEDRKPLTGLRLASAGESERIIGAGVPPGSDDTQTQSCTPSPDPGFGSCSCGSAWSQGEGGIRCGGPSAVDHGRPGADVARGLSGGQASSSSN